MTWLYKCCIWTMFKWTIWNGVDAGAAACNFARNHGSFRRNENELWVRFSIRMNRLNSTYLPVLCKSCVKTLSFIQISRIIMAAVTCSHYHLITKSSFVTPLPTALKPLLILLFLYYNYVLKGVNNNKIRW